MKKIILISGIGIVIILISVFFIFSKNAVQNTEQNKPNGTFPIGENTNNIGSDATLSIKTSSGTPITVQNFLINQDTVPDKENSGHYYLGNNFPSSNATPTKMPKYIIEYIASTNYFNIGLFSEPIATARLDAEQYLLQELGITKEQMCMLNYTVSAPVSVNEYYSGTNLGFSFCPGSVPL